MGKRMGRPTVPAKDRKNATVVLRVKRGEKRTMEQAAKRAGKSLSEWARNILLSADDVIQ